MRKHKRPRVGGKVDWGDDDGLVITPDMKPLRPSVQEVREAMRDVAFEQVPAGQLPLALVGSDGTLGWWVEAMSKIDGVEGVSSGPAVVAHVDGALAGLLAYQVSRRRCLDICAVWVAPPLRRAGLAKQLFCIAASVERPKSVSASVISPEGLQYLLWVRKTFAGRVRISRKLHTNLVDMFAREVFGS